MTNLNWTKSSRIGWKPLLTAVLAAALLLSSGGCIYFNTFYNASKSFKEAERARESSKFRRGSVNRAAYEKAIEKALVVVENHPNSGWYDDALFILAVSYFHTDRHGKAERRFREILADYGESKYVEESELYLAKCKLELQEEGAAMEVFQNIFTSDFPREFKAEAAMALGSYYYKNKEYGQTLQYYQAVRDSLGTDEDRLIAQRQMADALFADFRFAEALNAYLQILGMKPDNIERYHAMFQASTCAFRLMRISDGMEYVDQMIADESFFDSLGVLLIHKGLGFEAEEDYVAAERVYQEVTKESDRPLLQGEANHRLGLIYQFEYDDLLGAKRYYDEAARLGGGREFGKDALQRSADIGKLDKFSQRLALDSTATQTDIDEAVFAQYQLAELYWFQLNEPDSAISEMRYIVDSMPEGYDTPKALIALASMVREASDDSAAAESLLYKVLNDYPRSDHVATAVNELGLKGMSADTGYALWYIHRAEDFLIDSNNVDSAKYYYQHVVDSFPNSNHYLQARFSLIWLQEEYVSPGDSSVYFAYTEFIDSFPASPWASQARVRIEGTSKELASREDERQPDGDTVLANVDDSERDALRDRVADDPFGIDSTRKDYYGTIEGYYIREGDTLILLDEKPREIREEFVYPTEAYRDAWEGTLYFQIELDFIGEVIDLQLMNRSGNTALDQEAVRIVKSMIFDRQRVNLEYTLDWFVYKYDIKKPEHLR